MSFINCKTLLTILFSCLGLEFHHATSIPLSPAVIENIAFDHPVPSLESSANNHISPIESRANSLIPSLETRANLLAPSLENRAEKALAYSTAHKMNTSYCILVDMSIPSGKNRLFVYDFQKKKTIIKGLCAHGIGGGSTAFKVVFSNKVKSNCSSLGKYKLGKRAYSNWGIHAHYKMHGLDSTNSNAYKRIIVLHSYSPVPEHEIHPYGLFNISQGCPVIADLTMLEIDKLIKSGEKNMLLWIYN